jgi:hypothetical protein
MNLAVAFDQSLQTTRHFIISFLLRLLSLLVNTIQSTLALAEDMILCRSLSLSLFLSLSLALSFSLSLSLALSLSLFLFVLQLEMESENFFGTIYSDFRTYNKENTHSKIHKYVVVIKTYEKSSSLWISTRRSSTTRFSLGS